MDVVWLGRIRWVEEGLLDFSAESSIIHSVCVQVEKKNLVLARVVSLMNIPLVLLCCSCCLLVILFTSSHLSSTSTFPSFTSIFYDPSEKYAEGYEKWARRSC